MDEVRQISEAIEPHYTFLVIDAMTGQDAVSTAEAFHDTLELDGVILTKLDGDARGGAALSVKEVVGRPIAFASTGEKLKDFDLFHPDRLAGRILGMGDMLTLIEKAEQVYEKDQAEAAATKMLEGQFTLDDFLDQMQQLKKMGPLGASSGCCPGCPRSSATREIDDREMAAIEAIIRSMTVGRAADPDLIDASRRVRIAGARGTARHPGRRVGQAVQGDGEDDEAHGRSRIEEDGEIARKAGKGKSKGPGGSRSSGGRVAPQGKPPLRLPNFDPAALGEGGKGLGGLPDLGAGGAFPDLGGPPGPGPRR